MITVLYYLLKVVICSGLLFSYYWLVLRNKQFHQYNRFYLLGISIISWVVPFIKIGIVRAQISAQPAIVHLASVVAEGNSSFEQVVVEKSNQFTWDNLLIAISLAITLFFIIKFVVSLWKVGKLIMRYPIQELMGLSLVMTNVKGTPFSFFNYIFWNTSIDLKSEVGQRILAHEVVHIEENHSFDKLIIELQLVIGWVNPFTWFIRNELYLIHEFIADQHSIENNDAGVLAQLLLASAYPQQQHILTNTFFFSPIKRRIQMLTQSSNPKFSYFRRLAILPILTATVLLFAFRNGNDNSRPIVKLEKTYTVVIDAGHGGSDPGATALDGTNEKDMALLIVKKLKSLNNNPNINIVLTRESDKFISATERANFSNKEKADLFLSIHMGGSDNVNDNGALYFVPFKFNKHFKESELLANTLLVKMSNIISNGNVTRKKSGIWVVESVNMPAVLVECGYITNKNDFQIVKSNQDIIASQLLLGIENYLSSKSKTLPIKNEVSVTKPVSQDLTQTKNELIESKKDLEEAKEAIRAIDSIDFASKISDLISNLDLNGIAKSAMNSAKVSKKVRDSILKLDLNKKVKEAMHKAKINEAIKNSLKNAIKISEDLIDQQKDTLNNKVIVMRSMDRIDWSPR